MIRLGLIGCGAHSESGHAIPLARYKAAHPDEILLAAVCDVRIERALDFGRKYGFLAAYQNVDEMLRQENLDGCIAVVPPENISELGIKLLTSGVFRAWWKSLSAHRWPKRGRSVTRAAATKTANMVSVNRRFMPSSESRDRVGADMPALFATCTALSPGMRARSPSSCGPQRSTRSTLCATSQGR